MKKYAVIFIMLLCSLLFASYAVAEQIKAFVGGFSVSGVQNKEEMQGTLQTLLASRLNSETIVTMDTAKGADALVTGSYVVLGKMFSLDATAKDASGNVMARVFEQGESQDDLIPAITKLAHKLNGEIVKGIAASVAALPPAAPAISIPVKQDAAAQTVSDIIKAEAVAKNSNSGWSSQRLKGVMIGIAPGRTLENGDRELYVVDDHALRLYRQGAELKLLAEVAFGVSERILSVDTADLDGDGIPEAYLSIQTGENLASQVWIARDGALKKLAEKLPYFFRAIALDGKDRKIYVQQMGRDADFYGDVFELVKNGDGYEMKNPIKLPRFGYLYNFNKFSDAAGKNYDLVINGDGYIIISSAGEEMWRSSDKFGGSELYFKREDLTNIKTTGDQYRWTFLEQRIVVTPAGEIVIPKNEGLFVFGNNRAYKKNSVFCFTWNGATLDERWHTKQSQNYLADFSFDVARKELILLEVVKKEGLIDKGASAIVVRKVE